MAVYAPSSPGAALPSCAPVKVQPVTITAARMRMMRAQARVLGLFAISKMRSLRPALPQFMVVAVRRSVARFSQEIPISVLP